MDMGDELPPQLCNLTVDDIDLLDAVIARAGATATTFLSIFKPYSDVLSERGLDTQETYYYDKLLKLGFLKQKTWSDKWAIVRERQPVLLPRVSRPTRPDVLRALGPSRMQTRGTSVTADTDDIFSQATNEHVRQPHTQYHHTESDPDASSLDQSESYEMNRHPLLFPPVNRTQRRTWRYSTSELTDEGPAPTLPPSYHSPDQSTETASMPGSPAMTPHHAPQRRMVAPPKPAHRQPTKASIGERRNSVVNDEEAWRKVKMLQDEQIAVEFCDERLLERCWEVWKQGFLWIQRTSEQVHEARDHLLLRITLQRWQERSLERHRLGQRVSRIYQHKLLRKVLARWKHQVKIQKQSNWRRMMRENMRVVRSSRDSRLQLDAWARWRLLFQSHQSDQHHSRLLTRRSLRLWRTSLLAKRVMQTKAEQFYASGSGERALRVWDHWRRTTELRQIEAVVKDRVSTSLLHLAFNRWTERRDTIAVADEFYDRVAARHILRRWQAAVHRIQGLIARADRHIAKQDHLLLITVARIWKAQERCRLLGRVKARRTLKEAFSHWRLRMDRTRALQAMATDFALRTNSQLSVAAYRVWRTAFTSHQNATVFADQYHNAQLRYRFLTQMRLKLRDHLRSYKKARLVAVTLTKRRAFRGWIAKFQDAQRERKLLCFQDKCRNRYFDQWRDRVQQQIRYRIAEQTISSMVEKRMTSKALARWTERVIEVKLREIDVSQRANNALVNRALDKWRALRVRHVEEFSLMESYQIIKQNEIVRRLFHRWLAGARVARYRTVTLQRKEKEMKLKSLQWAWDKWSDRYNDERLRPLEISLLLQTQKNMLYQAYGIWYSRTKTIPALRLYNGNIKARAWLKWVGEIPRALQSRDAKDKYRRYLLSVFLRNWVEQYRTRLARRAIARARHLRLPTSSQARSRPSSIPRSETRSTPTTREPDPGSDDEASVTGSQWPRSRGSGSAWANLKLPSRKETSPAKWRSAAPSVRSTSPARSLASAPALTSRGVVESASEAPRSVGGDSTAGRSRLWLELREVKRDRPPRSQTIHSRD